MNECEREGEEGGGADDRGEEEGRRRIIGGGGGGGGQRKEECIPGRVNPWGLEWLTIPWIRAFRLIPPSTIVVRVLSYVQSTLWVRINHSSISYRLRSIPRFLISRDSPSPVSDGSRNRGEGEKILTHFAAFLMRERGGEGRGGRIVDPIVIISGLLSRKLSVDSYPSCVFLKYSQPSFFLSIDKRIRNSIDIWTIHASNHKLDREDDEN